MSTTLTASLQAAVAQAGVAPRLVIDIAAAGGTEHWSTEAFRWSGIDYQARIMQADALACPLGAPEHGILPAKTFAVTLANADGFFSRRRPGYYAGHTLTAREILLGVESDALRTFTFTIAKAGMPSLEQFRLDCAETWIAARRQRVPADRVLLTSQMYPMLPDQSPVRGLPVPVLFGRTLCPMYYVGQNQTTAAAAFPNVATPLPECLYVACVNSASVPSDGGNAFEMAFDGQLSPLQTASGTQSWSLQYAIRNGVPVTEVRVLGSAYDSNLNLVPRWIDLVGPDTDSAGFPDAVFLTMCCDPLVGAGVDPTTISSDALLTARSFYLANSLTCDGVLTVQRPLEDWLGDWMHDTMTGLVLRDTIRLTPQASRTAQGSLHLGNIVRGSLTYDDAPLEQLETTWTVLYRERTKDVGSLSFYSFTAQSGTPAAPRSAPFIGRASVAAKVAQLWANRNAVSARTHTVKTTLRAAGVEEGDLFTLAHPWIGPQTQLAEVTDLSRGDGLLTLSLRETDPSVWQTTNLPTDLPYPIPLRSVLVAYDGTSKTAPATITSSHTLHATPTRVEQQNLPWWQGLIASSLVSANNSQFTVAVAARTAAYPNPQLSIVVDGGLIGWQLRVDPDLI